ncbi:MAG TPA: hypothetical protein VLA43_01270, partial [Longimicrobiales bacterium]|nr:hypothetical protein [Longimicrobiales bacterium]
SRTPAVGASAYTREGRTYAAWAEQASETVEIREVTSDGTVGWSWSQQISTWCRNLLDFAVTPSGEHAVLSCVGEEGVSDPKYVAIGIPYAF